MSMCVIHAFTLKAHVNAGAHVCVFPITVGVWMLTALKAAGSKTFQTEMIISHQLQRPARLIYPDKEKHPPINGAKQQAQ